jgi:hypothetical protein
MSFPECARPQVHPAPTLHAKPVVEHAKESEVSVGPLTKG